MKPYRDKIKDDHIFREFDINGLDEELIWHRDNSNRKVTVIESDGWKFQLDNCSPVEMQPGDIFIIEKMKYHRIIKGKNNLKIKIKEF